MTHRILAAPNGVLANLVPSDKLEIRKFITVCIMGTEMAKHFEHLEQLQEISTSDFDHLDKSAQTHLSSHVVHCADLSGQVLDWKLAKVWGLRCIKEFQEQSARELDLELPLTPFMQNLDHYKHAMLLQSGFIDTIVLPLWTAMVDCFPGELEGRIAQCQVNSNAYKTEAASSAETTAN
jgi:hypothetical protein